jgi:hypothetical protein
MCSPRKGKVLYYPHKNLMMEAKMTGISNLVAKQRDLELGSLFSIY